MIRFLKAAFTVTWFQIVIVALFSALKYVFQTAKFGEKITIPFIWISFGVVFLFVSTALVINLIDRESNPFEPWKVKSPRSRKQRLLSFYTTWGIAAPVLLFYMFLMYLFAPTSWTLAIALYAGIVIRNIVNFFAKKENTMNQETN